ncbi:RidA family protein [Tropicibacter naphthalenivorans]|uniref:Putative endoribonuclease L-PSP n=1 Tax=Tropicibacter naphthalenivorans TaxID=441103 RepID=A0A0P1GA79_9RHOB|nr:RidA family protein [Tropicibacter naphthalenivorans]CUH78418.1 putative endoribonuclease L-PSP [Tropicibacter naphthalenivorans]SMC80294.1 Enamine deaminase RidA, house cleaning of reactive enamine intermediates, YjgF/YER057c/UK114 family [Tropicibacter naphthalenivorans]
MSNAIESRLAELGLTLPDAPAPAANYVPYVISGKQIFISGQISMKDGAFWTGKVGADLTTEEGAEAAKSCAMALLAQARAACSGDLSKLGRLVKLVGFVNSTPEFTEQPKVINGASDLMVEVLGEAGRHARSAVSAGALPFNVAVEIEAIFELA